MAERLRSGGGAPLGEIFAFVSGLYFRGKLAYARAFGSPPAGLPPAFVITPCRGLLSAETLVGTMDLEEFRSVPMDPAEPAYRLPLETSAQTLTEAAPDCDVILLGSIATAKYVEVLQSAFGERLLFPVEFLGRGDMEPRLADAPRRGAGKRARICRGFQPVSAKDEAMSHTTHEPQRHAPEWMKLQSLSEEELRAAERQLHQELEAPQTRRMRERKVTALAQIRARLGLELPRERPTPSVESRPPQREECRSWFTRSAMSPRLSGRWMPSWRGSPQLTRAAPPRGGSRLTHSEGFMAHAQ